MSQTDFIPRPDAAFDRYFRAMSQYVNTKTTGTSPAWTHIPSPERLAFNEQYANWYNAYALTFNPHSPDITREKNRVRAIAESALRAFINRFLRWPPEDSIIIVG